MASPTPFRRALDSALGQLAHLQAGDFDAYEADLAAYAEAIAELLTAELDAAEIAELARIDAEASRELARLKDEVVARLAGMAKRGQAASAYLTHPSVVRSDARSA